MGRGAILMVDDDRNLCEAVAQGLERRGFTVTWATAADEALRKLQQGAFDAVLGDMNMPTVNGVEMCKRMTAYLPDLPVIMVTAFGSLDSAVAAIRAGAYDFITKPFELESVALMLDRAVGHRALRDEVRRLRRAVTRDGQTGPILGESGAVKDLHDLLVRVADTDASLLITGETGTGKELVARELHRMSGRQRGPFVAINCAAIPEAVLESELFGHARGAFTDAKVQRAGLFVEANGGTLFLDEIGDLPLPLQPKLLRALQERRVRPMGSNTEQPVDVRILAATNKDLEGAVEAGTFRQDLLYRINVIGVHIPPLRARGTDVLLLAQHFLEALARRGRKQVVGLTPPAAEKLLAYSWPGNVRELQNCMERAVALTRHDQITVEDLPETVRHYEATHVIWETGDPRDLLPLEEVERRYILRALQTVGGNKSIAARVLGVDRKTLYRKLERFEAAGAASLEGRALARPGSARRHGEVAEN
jgi:DNA-binding NtrC family response regulator